MFDHLERLASNWLAQHDAVGMKMLWEVLRWQIGTSRGRRPAEVRFNNNFTSRYARLLLARHPEWEGRIHIRALRT